MDAVWVFLQAAGFGALIALDKSTQSLQPSYGVSVLFCLLRSE